MTEEELRASAGSGNVWALENEIRRLREELESVRKDRHDLWQLVDREIDRIYADAKGVERWRPC